MPVNIKITGDEKEPITPPEPEGVKIEVVEKDKKFSINASIPIGKKP